MLRVIVEIVPFGNEDEKRTVDTLEIVNTGKNKRRPSYGDYKFDLFGGDIQATGEIKNHRRSSGYWELIRRIIKEL